MSSESLWGVVPPWSVRSTLARQNQCRWQVLPRVLHQPRPWHWPLPPLPFPKNFNQFRSPGWGARSPHISEVYPESPLRPAKRSFFFHTGQPPNQIEVLGRRHMPWLLSLGARDRPGIGRDKTERYSRTKLETDDGMIRTLEMSRIRQLENGGPPSPLTAQISKPQMMAKAHVILMRCNIPKAKKKVNSSLVSHVWRAIRKQRDIDLHLAFAINLS